MGLTNIVSWVLVWFSDWQTIVQDGGSLIYSMNIYL